MKTDPKNSNASRAPSHPELIATDTNPRRLFEVVVSRTDYLFTRIRVEAESEDEAEAEAKTLAELRPDERWDVADRDLFILETSQVTEGGSHV